MRAARFVEAHARASGERRRGDGVFPVWAGVGDGPAKDVIQQGVGFGDDVLAWVGRAVVGCGDERVDQMCQGMVVARDEGPGEVPGVAVVECAGDVKGVDGPHGYLRVAAGAGGVDLSTAPPRRYLAFTTPLSIPAIRGARRAVGVVARHGWCGRSRGWRRCRAGATVRRAFCGRSRPCVVLGGRGVEGRGSASGRCCWATTSRMVRMNLHRQNAPRKRDKQLRTRCEVSFPIPRRWVCRH